MAVDVTALFPRDQVLTPDDGKLYEESIRRWAENAERKAKYIILPKSAEDISKAVRGLPDAHNVYIQFFLVHQYRFSSRRKTI